MITKFLLAGTALVTLTAGSAMAADLGRPAPLYSKAPPVAYNWTGFYIGGNIGGAWGLGNNVTDSLFGVNFGNGNSNGVFIGGGQVGANYQFSNIVLGVEGDFDWAANNNNTSGVGVVIPGVGTFQAFSNDRWITTVAARFGVAVDQWLFYGKAGGGWVGNNGITVTNVATGASISGSNSNPLSGWLVGGGIECAFAGNWSAKVEYDYLGLGSQLFVVSAGSPVLAGDTLTTGRANIQMVKLGINYRFGWDNSVTARY